jgi:transposase InsO family protein
MIMVIVNQFSKAFKFITCNSKINSQGVARHFQDWVFVLYRMPQIVISNKGPQFASKFMKDLWAMLGITRNMSTAYHPQTNGQTECVNQEIKQYLRIFINYQQSDWAEWLFLAEFSYNNCVHLATRQSPFFVNYGQHP